MKPRIKQHKGIYKCWLYSVQAFGSTAIDAYTNYLMAQKTSDMEYAKTAWRIDNLMSQIRHPDDSVRMYADGDGIVFKPSINEEKAMNCEPVPYGSIWYKG